MFVSVQIFLPSVSRLKIKSILERKSNIGFLTTFTQEKNYIPHISFSSSSSFVYTQSRYPIYLNAFVL